ncbi:hypothetical protein E2542_SST15366 [Spatholobus suberectus]|nr:hypothetical protein E2542_SST15366 [Spatholobus suberectus]
MNFYKFRTLERRRASALVTHVSILDATPSSWSHRERATPSLPGPPRDASWSRVPGRDSSLPACPHGASWW